MFILSALIPVISRISGYIPPLKDVLFMMLEDLDSAYLDVVYLLEFLKTQQGFMLLLIIVLASIYFIISPETFWALDFLMIESIYKLIYCAVYVFMFIFYKLRRLYKLFKVLKKLFKDLYDGYVVNLHKGIISVKLVNDATKIVIHGILRKIYPKINWNLGMWISKLILGWFRLKYYIQHILMAKFYLYLIHDVIPTLRYLLRYLMNMEDDDLAILLVSLGIILWIIKNLF